MENLQTQKQNYSFGVSWDVYALLFAKHFHSSISVCFIYFVQNLFNRSTSIFVFFCISDI